MLQYWPTLYRVLYWLVVPLSIALFAAFTSNELVERVDWLNEREINTQFEIGRQFGQRAGTQWDRDLMIVSINQRSFEVLPANETTLKRRNYARLINLLKDAGAKGLYIDLTMLHPSEDDKILREAFEKSGTLFIALASFWRDGAPDKNGRIQQVQRRADLSYLIGNQVRDHVIPVSNVRLVNDASGGEFGQASFYVDGNKSFVGSAYAVALMLHGKSPQDLEANLAADEVNAGALGWTFDGNYGQRLYYRTPIPAWATISIHDAFELTPSRFRERFKNKVVLLGLGSDIEGAVVDSPIGLIDGTTWTAQLANALSQPGNKRITFFRSEEITVWLILLAMTSAHFGRLVNSFVGWLGILSLVLVAAFLPQADIFMGNRMLETVAPVLATVISFAIASFAFVLMPIPTKAPGHSFHGAVVFFDIEDSTGIIDRVGSQQYRKFFGEWCRMLDQVAARKGGEIERTTGDGAFVVFPVRKQSTLGVSAIMFVTEALERTKSLAIRHKYDYQVRAGVEVGQMTGSYVRESGRLSWSSVGPCVNLAKRLLDEKIEGEHRVRLGPTISSLVREKYKIRKIKTFVPKGFSEELPIFIMDELDLGAGQIGSKTSGET